VLRTCRQSDPLLAAGALLLLLLLLLLAECLLHIRVEPRLTCMPAVVSQPGGRSKSEKTTGSVVSHSELCVMTGACP
jgi:hypothetical protein